MTVSLDRSERRFLDAAIAAGRRGWGRVHPNPMVGCVLVRDGEVVAEGVHEEFGGPHAEVNALRSAGEGARGATAYVSLEPCAHEGKTPPCTEALIRAGVRRVVFGAGDPGERSGGGGAVLRAAGVEVVGPVLTDAEAWALNPAFHHHSRGVGPYVALKLAMTLDGKLAAAPGVRTQLTGPAAQEHVHWLRAGFDGIMVGSRTAAVDDPLLTVRGSVTPRRPPSRIVLDTGAGLSPGAALFRESGGPPVIVFVGESADEGRVAGLVDRGADVRRIPVSDRGLDLGAVTSALGESGYRAILCEGGGRLGASLLVSGLARRLYVYLAPRVLGSDGVPAFPGSGWSGGEGWRLAEAPLALGDDALVVYDRVAEPEAAGSR